MEPLTRIIDISLPLKPDMPIWPGSVGIQISRTLRLDAGDPANVSRLDCDVHVGTHVDAPLHHIKNGCSVDSLSLDDLVGPATVAYLPTVASIAARDLEDLAIPAEARRLLLRTRNSDLWSTGAKEFATNYVGLTADAADWVVDRGIRLIGIDYLSIQRYDDSPLTHQLILRAGVIILEGLNLAGVQAGTYDLICLPLKLAGAEAAPARAILLTTDKREMT